MATITEYVQELMDEYGKTGIDVRRKFEESASEVILDLLLQNRSRFRRLEKSVTLTFVATDDAERIPGDFRTIKTPMVEVESDGTLVDKVEIVSDSEFLRRKADASYGGSLYAHIETRTAPIVGEYLVLNVEPTETRYFKFSYYRRPTAEDADIIENEGVVKDGIRAKRRDIVGPDNAANSLILYRQSRRSVIQHPGQRATGLQLRPDRQQARKNRLMHKIGRRR